MLFVNDVILLFNVLILVANDPKCTIELYDDKSSTWKIITIVPNKKLYCSVAVANCKIIVFGGVDASGADVQTWDAFDVITGTWLSAEAEPDISRPGYFSGFSEKNVSEFLPSSLILPKRPRGLAHSCALRFEL